MAGEERSFRGVDPPELNYARRLVERYHLSPPVDVSALVRQYADLEQLEIPFDVDGISLNLKVPGRRPKVLINSQSSERRKRFTLAHELGHIVIPWHVGSIVDVTETDIEVDDDYWFIEAEANRFASELLMPTSWVAQVCRTFTTPRERLSAIYEQAEVSAHAAVIKLIQIIAPGHVFAEFSEDRVNYSGRSPGTIANAPRRGESIDPQTLYPNSGNLSVFRVGNYDFYWWEFSDSADLLVLDDPRQWREILTQILADVGLAGQEFKSRWSSINAICAYAKSHTRESNSPERFLAAALQRFESKPELATIASHPDFMAFLNKKAQEFYNVT